MKRISRNYRRKTYILALAASALTSAFQCSAATHYVSQASPNPTPPYSTVDTAAHTIQEAVDVAADGDTVLVEPGDYALTNQVTVTKGILLQGASGASQTFLTAQKMEGIDMWCLWMTSPLAAADGLSFRSHGVSGESAFGAFVLGGNIQNCTFSNLYVGKPGGSIVISGGMISNTIVAYLRGAEGAAAVSCADGGLVTDSQILGVDSSAFGSAIALVSSRLQNSVISGVSRGGLVSGVAVSALSSSVVDCTISNNFSLGNGGGAYLQDSLMDRCIVTGNTAGGEGSGGGGVFETNSIVRNSLIVSNHTILASAEPSYGSLGGGVYLRGGALVNCTVAGNSAFDSSSVPGGGGGVFADGGGITNCIIYFNSLSIDRVSSNWLSMGTVIFDHCNTAPDPGGAGNITQDPQFTDFPNGNYHSASTSPCIGAGVVQSWMAEAQDLDGNPRTTGGRVDMGAYQDQYPATSILSIVRAGSNIVLRWPSAGTDGLVLQQLTDLRLPEGWTPSSAAVTDDGTTKSATIRAMNNMQFFRLHGP